MVEDKFEVYREGLELSGILGKAKGVVVEVYTNAPYRLLLRAVENNVRIKLEDGRFIICKADEHGTSIANILASDVDNCKTKVYNSSQFDVIIRIQDLCYRIRIIR